MSRIHGSFLVIAPGTYSQREALVQRRRRFQRLGVMFRARPDILIEYVPMPQLPVATKIKLARANPTDWHADVVEILASIYGAFSTRGK